MNTSNSFGYVKNDTIIHQINGSTKLIAFILLSLIVMTNYDTRFLLGVTLFNLFIFYIFEIPWENIRIMIYFVLFFSILT